MITGNRLSTAKQNKKRKGSTLKAKYEHLQRKEKKMLHDNMELGMERDGLRSINNDLNRRLTHLLIG